MEQQLLVGLISRCRKANSVQFRALLPTLRPRVEERSIPATYSVRIRAQRLSIPGRLAGRTSVFEAEKRGPNPRRGTGLCVRHARIPYRRVA